MCSHHSQTGQRDRTRSASSLHATVAALPELSIPPETSGASSISVFRYTRRADWVCVPLRARHFFRASSPFLTVTTLPTGTCCSATRCRLLVIPSLPSGPFANEPTRAGATASCASGSSLVTRGPAPTVRPRDSVRGSSPRRRQSPPTARLVPPPSPRPWARRLPGRPRLPRRCRLGPGSRGRPRPSEPAGSCQGPRGRARAAAGGGPPRSRRAGPVQAAAPSSLGSPAAAPRGCSPSIISCDCCGPAPRSAAMLAALSLSGICRLRPLSQSGLATQSPSTNVIPAQGPAPRRACAAAAPHGRL